MELQKKPKLYEGVTFYSYVPGIYIEETTRGETFSMNTKHFHDSCELYFLLDGGDRLYFVENDMQRITPGMALLIDSGVIHRTSPWGDEKLHHRFMLQLDPNHFNDYFQRLGYKNGEEFMHQFAGAVTFSPEEWTAVTGLIQVIRNEIQRKAPGGQERVPFHCLELLLLFFMKRSHVQEMSDDDGHFRTGLGAKAKIHEIAIYLDNHAAEEVSIEMLCRLFSMSHASLTRTFKAVTGFTVIEYHNFCRIRKAKQLLKDTALSVTEVASLTGFSNVAYFERVFRMHTSDTPSSYRRSVR